MHGLEAMRKLSRINSLVEDGSFDSSRMTKLGESGMSTSSRLACERNGLQEGWVSVGLIKLSTEGEGDE